MNNETNLYGNAYGLNRRGRYATLASALDDVFQELVTEKNPFFDAIVDHWGALFPQVPARPGRSENGKIFLYVKNAPTFFMMRSRLKKMAAELAKLPGAPKKIDLRLEIHAQ